MKDIFQTRFLKNQLHICKNPENIQHQKRIPMYTTLWVLMLCQCRVINGNTYTTLVQDMLIAGEVVHVWGQQVYGNRTFCSISL